MSENINIQKSALVWLDDSTNDPQDAAAAQQQLRLINSNFTMLKSIKDYEEFVKSQPADASITLIVNGRLGHELVPNIHTSAQIHVIYIYCMNIATHEKWAADYNKVKLVSKDFEEIIKALQPNRIVIRRSIIKEVPLTDASEPVITPVPIAYELDGLYLISSGCFDYLVRMKIQPKERDEFVSFFEEALPQNEKLLAIIRKFKSDYSPDQAILWFNKDDFFHTFINNIFRYAFIDAMLPCLVLIRDVQKQLAQHKCTSTTQVYRSDIISDVQFQQLKTFNGKIIAMKFFLLTNLNRDKVLSYTAHYSPTNESKRVLFIIDANPEIENVKPFTKIGSLDQTADQDDIMFTIGSLFKINEIADEKDGIIIIKLSLCANDNTNTLKELYDQLISSHMNEQVETDVIGFGRFVIDFGNSMRDSNLSNSGEKIIRTIEKSLDDDRDRVRCYDTLGYIELYQKNFDPSFGWYEKSLNIKKENLHLDGMHLIENYENLAAISFQKKDYTKALDYFEKASAIYKQSFGDDNMCLVSCYTHIAVIYERQENYMQAISYYHSILAIMTKQNHAVEADYAPLYSCFGNVYTALKHYHLALGYYNTSLEITLRIDPTATATIAKIYRSIADVHKSMNDIEQARTNFEKALKIYRDIQSSDDSDITDIEERIRNLPTINQN